tara:strand:- start:1468 stop:1944 length:477 start_codon:yes stop_codon:yes gene_type:complete
MPQSEDSSETTPVLQNGVNPVQKAKDKRNQMKGKAISKINESQRKVDCFMYSCAFCVLGTFVTVVILSIIYFVNGYAERDRIDHDESTVYERWKDYTTGELVNCSSDHPCRDWTCEYVKEHFPQAGTPDECQYDDWIDQILICLSILTFCALCACLFG